MDVFDQRESTVHQPCPPGPPSRSWEENDLLNPGAVLEYHGCGSETAPTRVSLTQAGPIVVLPDQ
jgi:hypothetical protein